MTRGSGRILAVLVTLSAGCDSGKDSSDTAIAVESSRQPTGPRFVLPIRSV